MKQKLLKILTTKKANIVLSVLIFLGIVIYLFCSQPKTVAVAVKDDILSLSYKNLCYSINVTDITSLQKLDSLNMGSKVSGEENSGAKFGTWKNGTLGEYTLAINPAAEHYIVIKAKGNTYVMNFESTGTTDEFYTALNKLLKEKNVKLS